MSVDSVVEQAFTTLLRKAQRPEREFPAHVVDLAFVLGQRGAPITVDEHLFVRLGLNGTATVISWSLAGTISDVSASATFSVDVQVGATLATLASICGGDEPALTSDFELTEQPPTANWTPQIPDPSWVQAVIATTGGSIERVCLTLRLLVE